MDGFTPLHSAVSITDSNLDNSTAVRALLECGADANGAPPSSQPPSGRASRLLTVAWSESAATILEGQYAGWSPLHCAVSRGRVNAVRELTRHQETRFQVLNDVASM